jgi:hypothetical protein
MAIRIRSKSIRKQIKNIIDEQYKENIEKDFGMIILKELIQNANDASATSLYYGYHEGISDSENPLLQNPGLFFINDGDFKKSDLISINTMWDNSKGNNPNQIGKFGLGLKSVFHWCEAFFYFSSGISDSFKNEEAKKNYNDKFEIFNPWEPTFDEVELNENPQDDIKPYPDWSINSDDYKLIVSSLYPLIEEMKPWFCIWIPLRTKKLEKKPAFKNFYPGDDRNFDKLFEDKNLLNDILSILPFMSKLKEISYWRKNQSLHKIYSFINEVSFPLIEEKKFKVLTPYFTNVLFNDKNISNVLISYMHENSTEIEALIQDSDFPKNEDGKPEKAFNQGAVSISIINESDKSGNIILDWCVFLPLSEKRYIKTIEKFTIHIKLHGWFFIDSGRNTIDFGDENTELTIKQKWNRLIAQQNTIPQLIHVIVELIKTESDRYIIEEIVRHIRESDLYKIDWMKKSLFLNYSIIKRFTAEDENWEVIKENEKFYLIDNKIYDFKNHFPTFLPLLDNHIFITNEKNYLGLEKVSDWKSFFFEKFFEVDFSKLLGVAEFRKYWISEIKEQLKDFDSNDKEKIELKYLEIIKNYLIDIEWKKIEEFKEAIQQILIIISDKVITLSIETKNVFESLNSLNLNLLFLPKKQYEYENSLCNDDSVKILNCICDFQAGNRHKLSQEILIKSQYLEIKDEIIDLPIFETTDNKSISIFVSINDIDSKIVVDANSRNDYIMAYCNAFQNIAVYKFSFYNDLQKIKDHIPKIKFFNLDLTSYMINKDRHEFNDFSNRKMLIDTFIKEYKIEYKNTIRKLFLAKIEDTNQKIFIFKKDDLWYKISLEILKKNDESYRIFLDEDSKLFEEKVQKELNISVLSEIPSELLEYSLQNVDLKFLGESDKNMIYEKAYKNSNLLSLPIYNTVNGDTISISDKLNDVYMLTEETESESDEIPMENIFLLPCNKFLALVSDIKRIDNKSLLKIYLKSPKPEKYCTKIFDKLNRIYKHEIDEELKKLMSEIAWLPSKNEIAYSFSDILHHEYSKDFDEIVTEYNKVSSSTCSFISSSSLQEDFVKHPGFNKISEYDLWMNEEEVWEKVGSLISAIPNLNIGKLDENQKDFELLEIAFEKVQGVQIIDFFNKWKSNVSKSFLENYIYPAMFKNHPNMDTQERICSFLENTIKEKFGDEKKKLQQIHLDLLYSYLLHNKNTELLHKINLPNQNNDWKKAEYLCLQHEMISEDFSLDSDYNNRLKDFNFISKPLIPDSKLSLNDHALFYNKEEIFKYLNEIANIAGVDRNLIGVFLSFLGDGILKWRSLAEENFLQEITGEQVRKEAMSDKWNEHINGLKDLQNTPTTNFELQKRDKKREYECFEIRNIRQIDIALKDTKIELVLSDLPKEMYNKTITGNRIEVKTKNTLLTMQKYKTNYKENHFFYKLFKLELFDKINFENLFIDAIQQILLEVYLIPKELSLPYNNNWEKFSKTHQVNILITQEMIFNELFSIFREFNIGRECSSVKKLFDDYYNIGFNKANCKINQVKYDSAEKEKLINEKLRNLLNDVNVKVALLKRIPDKLEKNYGYKSESVLYELFQNADDAYKQKQSLDGDCNDSRSLQSGFEIYQDNNDLYVIHHGRNINEWKGKVSKEEEHYGFKFDLLNMLLFNQSDKEFNNVTGKFGLGFKSVYLICDEPIIISGKLRFIIAGGIFPEEITPEKAKKYEDKIKNQFNTTMFHLPIRDAMDKPVDVLINDFLKHAHFLLIFSKAINSVKINGRDYKLEFEKWSIDKVKNIDICSFKNNKLLVFSSNDDSWKIVFKFTDTGFCELTEIKKVWVTVPTDTDTGYKFAINSSDFNIDVGRRQLAKQGNEEIFKKIGKDFYNILSELSACDQLPLSVNQYQFWKTLFDVLSGSDSKDLLHPIFWQKNEKNYLSLLKSDEVLPNGLYIKNELISLQCVKYDLADELNKPDYLKILENCDFPVKNCISQEIKKRLLSQIDLNMDIIDIHNFRNYLSNNLTKEQIDKVNQIEDQVKSKMISKDASEQRKIEKLLIEDRQKEENEITKFENQTKYSYGWFKCIVDASCNHNGMEDKKKPETVHFAKCTINESGDLIVLKNPSRFLLHSYETAESRTLNYGKNKEIPENEIKGVTFIENSVEVVLSKKLTSEKIQDICSMNHFSLKFENFFDVSQKLKIAFNALHLDYKYCLKKNLPKNIRFVFGPPGTGKTYKIAEEIIKYSNNSKKILVLAPTNKAADEVYHKVSEQEKEHKWMIRFGNCNSPKIIEEGNFLNSTAVYQNSMSAIITTAIRFSYDGFRNLTLSETKWDYLVFDEASMIPIQFITYIIHKAYKVNPACEFIIAGDPKQIPPIYNFAEKKLDKETYKEYKDIKEYLNGEKDFKGISIESGENIYSMVNLYDFVTKEQIEKKQIQLTEPHQFNIENLSIQHRSIPIIGKIYSHYAYNGLLTHERKDDEFKKLDIPEINFSNINIVNFPLSGGNIFHSQFVNKSHAHPYSALLIYEFLLKLDKLVTEKFEIGIISPYNPQVKMLDKLIGNSVYNNLDIQVNTVHGFQGGQKEIIFCVLNPPVQNKEGKEPEITCKDKALINKEFIINVAISRAKDYLFLFFPSDSYQSNDEQKKLTGHEKLYELQELKRIVKQQTDYITEMESSELEKWCFNRKDFIYQNSNVISHDLVNVYQKAPKRYLVSHSEQSIDVQIEIKPKKKRMRVKMKKA